MKKSPFDKISYEVGSKKFRLRAAAMAYARKVGAKRVAVITEKGYFVKKR